MGKPSGPTGKNAATSKPRKKGTTGGMAPRRELRTQNQIDAEYQYCRGPTKEELKAASEPFHQSEEDCEMDADEM